MSPCVQSIVSQGENFLVIDLDECIDCGACIPECPVEAIFEEDDVPDKWSEYIELNTVLAAQWPLIMDFKAPHADAEAMKDVEDKRSMLSTVPG